MTPKLISVCTLGAGITQTELECTYSALDWGLGPVKSHAFRVRLKHFGSQYNDKYPLL